MLTDDEAYDAFRRGLETRDRSRRDVETHRDKKDPTTLTQRADELPDSYVWEPAAFFGWLGLGRWVPTMNTRLRQLPKAVGEDD